MPRAKSTTEKLMAVAGGAPPSTTHQQSVPDFLNKMLFYPDAKQAAVIVADHAGHEFNQGDGAKLEQLKLLQKELDEHFEYSAQQLDEAQKALSKTSRTIKVAELNNPNNNSETESQNSTSFFQWRFIDKITSGLLCVSITTVMVMGGANVYANLMASGEPVFLEQPWLAICIAALAPCASMAFKLISQFFEYQSTKKKYSLFIYGLTLIATLCWTVMFSLTFTGVGGGLDVDAMIDGDGGKGAALVWLQLICEILVAGALFLALEDIALKYSPILLTENPDYIDRDKALKNHQSEHDELNKTRSDNHQHVVKLEATKQIFINERLADFNALRARFNSMNQF